MKVSEAKELVLSLMLSELTVSRFDRVGLSTVS